MDRYEGKPLLRLIECYILDSIDQLTSEQVATLVSMEPKLRAALGVTGTWKEIVAKTMDFPDTFPAQIKEIWQRNLDMAASKGASVSPEEFAMTFVDENFS